jgi:hypothetical protein
VALARGIVPSLAFNDEMAGNISDTNGDARSGLTRSFRKVVSECDLLFVPESPHVHLSTLIALEIHLTCGNGGAASPQVRRDAATPEVGTET